jgi:acyl carrier protein
MEEFVEPHVRRLVADHLGVGVEELVAEVSLRDDLAADSLDLLELAMKLETEFGIVISEHILDGVRTYGDLVEATGLLICARGEADVHGAEPELRIWAHLVSSAGESGGGVLERAGWLTPYTAETITEGAMRAGRGARLDIAVATSTNDVGIASVQHQFAWLAERGVQVTVRRDDRPAVRSLHPTATAALAARPAFTHRLLDQLTGVPTTVTVADYVGDDPWQADDLTACAGQGIKRFGDSTPAEQAQALSGSGPWQFVEDDPAGRDYRATTEGHHVHAHFGQPDDQAAKPPRDFVNKEPTHLEIGLGIARNTRYYQTDLCTELRPSGELLTWREATYYSQDRDGLAFDVASCMTRLTPAGSPSDRRQGLRAQFDLSGPSPNGFRPLTATLDGPGKGGVCTLLIHVSAQVAGKEQFARLALRRSVGSTMDVRLLPPAARDLQSAMTTKGTPV